MTSPINWCNLSHRVMWNYFHRLWEFGTFIKQQGRNTNIFAAHFFFVYNSKNPISSSGHGSILCLLLYCLNCKTILQSNILHNRLHPRSRATAKQVCQSFIWRSVKKDCPQWTEACLLCERFKISRHVSVPIVNTGQLVERFQHIDIEMKVMPYFSGYKYCLTCIYLRNGKRKRQL